MEAIQIEHKIKEILEEYTDMNWENIDKDMVFTDLNLNISNDTIVSILLSIDTLWNLPLYPDHLSSKDLISISHMVDRILYLKSLK